MACFYRFFLIIYAFDMLFLYFHFIFLFYMLDNITTKSPCKVLLRNFSILLIVLYRAL